VRGSARDRDHIRLGLGWHCGNGGAPLHHRSVVLQCQAEFFAGYTQFEPEIPRFFRESETEKGESKRKTGKPRRERSGLTAPERRDLESLPGRIEKAELAIAALEEKMMEPDIASDFSRLSAMTGEQEILKKELESLYERWQELEAKALA